jgi:Flp pilus assembly protein TadD
MEQGIENQSSGRERQQQPGHGIVRGGRLDEAIAHFRKPWKLRPLFIQAHCGLGGALALKGRTGEAITVLRHAMKIDANYAPLHTISGWP